MITGDGLPDRRWSRNVSDENEAGPSGNGLLNVEASQAQERAFGR